MEHLECVKNSAAYLFIEAICNPYSPEDVFRDYHMPFKIISSLRNIIKQIS